MELNSQSDKFRVVLHKYYGFEDPQPNAERYQVTVPIKEYVDLKDAQDHLKNLPDGDFMHGSIQLPQWYIDIKVAAAARIQARKNHESLMDQSIPF